MAAQPTTPPHDPPTHPAGIVCSAKGCRAGAVWALQWNNPRLHTPTRRKTWLACEEHRTSLSGFLDLRGFLRDVLPVDSLTTPDRS